MNSSNTNYIEEVLNITIVYLYKYLGLAFFILGNIGNVFSGVIFGKKAWRKNVCVFYFNICLLINSVFVNSYILGSTFIYGFDIQAQNSNVVLCKLYYYTSAVCSSLLPAALISASIDRLLMTSQNIETRLYSSRRLAYLSVSTCSMVWVVFNFHVLIKVDLQKIGFLTIQCSYDISRTYLQFLSYISLIITFSYCLTMIILSKLAFKNIRHIQPVPRQQRKQMRSMTKKDFQLLRCLFVYNIVYIICNLFLNLYYVDVVTRLGQYQTSLELAISDFIGKCLEFLRFIPFCGSFVIFMAVSKVFRHEVQRMIWQMFGKNLNPIREEGIRPENVERDSVNLNVVSTVVSP